MKYNSFPYIFLVGVSLFLYTSIRAFLLPITFDEAYTYLSFVRNGIIFSFQGSEISANNHILNTLLISVFTKWFGISEFVMRMPTLISHLCFLWFSALLVQQLENKKTAVFLFIIINVNPYLLDFFSLARGYGLSFGLLMASIYYLYCFYSGKKYHYLLFSMLLGALAVIANLVLLNYFIVLSGIFCLLIFIAVWQLEKNIMIKGALFFVKIILPAIIFALLFKLIIPVALKLKAAGALYYGGNHSFWNDTLSTLASNSLYQQEYAFITPVVSVGMALVVLSSAILSLYQIINKKTDKETGFLGILFLLLMFCSLSTIIQFHFMNNLYLINRVALFLIIPFNITLAFLINWGVKKRSFFRLFPFLISAILIIHFVLSFNLKYVIEWKFDADTAEMLADLEKIKTVPAEKPTINLGTSSEFESGIHFYRDVKNLTWLNTTTKMEGPDVLYDYYYVSPQELSGLNKDSIIVLNIYATTQNALVKQKYPVHKKKVVVQCEDFEKNTAENQDKTIVETTSFSGKKALFISSKDLFGNGLKIKIDSLDSGFPALISYSAMVKAANLDSCNLYMILSLDNERGLVFFQKADIKDFIKGSSWTKVSFDCILPKGALPGDAVVGYILNDKKHTLFVDDVELKQIIYSY